MATNMAKVRKFKDGLKLFIRGKIVGFLLQDMNFMVRTAMSIEREREIEDAWRIRASGTSEKRKEVQPSSSLGKRQKTSAPRMFQGRGHGYQGQGQTRASTQSRPLTCFHCHQPRHVRRDCPQRQGSKGFGIAQSQSSMGQARMRFVPSHPNAS